MNPESEYTRKNLTRFLCQELLYEFVTHRLDSHREQEINDFLPTCRESTRELENLNKGLRYSEIAAETKISEKLKYALENFEPHWKKQLREWTLWSSKRGWKMLPYAFVLLAVTLGIAATKPWIKTLNEDVMLAEQLKQEPDMMPKPAEKPPEKTIAAAVEARLPEEDELGDTPSQMPTVVPQLIQPPSLLVPPLSPTPQAVAVKAKPAPVPTPVSTPAPLAAPVVSVEADAARAASDAESMGRGFLYRAEIDVSDFHNSWPAIRDKIVALGGKVAGNVELGWLRKPTESYFHFTLPESNYPEFELFLGTFSPVRFSKDRHPRVMPEGQIRIILTVKDGMTANEGSSETP